MKSPNKMFQNSLVQVVLGGKLNETSLVEQRVPANLQLEYKKWLRFYLDFCKKYQFPAGKQNSLPAFLEKLHSERQAKTQCQQAQHAIELFYALM